MKSFGKRQRFYSEHRPTIPTPLSNDIKFSNFYPESPQISNLELEQGLEDLELEGGFLDGIKEAPHCQLEQSDDGSIDSFELEAQNYKKRNSEFTVASPKLAIEALSSKDDFHDDVSMLCLFDDDCMSDTDNGHNENRTSQPLVSSKRAFQIFAQGDQDDVQGTPNRNKHLDNINLSIRDGVQRNIAIEEQIKVKSRFNFRKEVSLNPQYLMQQGSKTQKKALIEPFSLNKKADVDQNILNEIQNYRKIAQNVLQKQKIKQKIDLTNLFNKPKLSNKRERSKSMHIAGRTRKIFDFMRQRNF